MVELLKEYLVEDALGIIPALMILGKIIKDTPKVQGWLIPYIVKMHFIPSLAGINPFDAEIRLIKLNRSDSNGIIQ